MIEYKVLKEVYDDMVSGKKDTEIRLLNEKSSGIKINDIIRFKILNNENVYVDTRVIDLKIYNNVEEVWKYRKNLLSSINTLNDFKNIIYSIYTKERVDNSKLIAIQFKLEKNKDKSLVAASDALKDKKLVDYIRKNYLKNPTESKRKKVAESVKNFV